MPYIVRIIVTDEFDEADFADIDAAQDDAQDLAKDIAREHLVNAVVESVRLVK